MKRSGEFSYTYHQQITGIVDIAQGLENPNKSVQVVHLECILTVHHEKERTWVFREYRAGIIDARHSKKAVYGCR